MQNNQNNTHWEWRYEMAWAIAEKIDMLRYGIKALYLIGSVKTGEAGPCSDIDLLAHCDDDKDKHALLRAWCEGYGQCLAEINECKTDYETEGSLLDLHIITDKHIEDRTSFAVMIDSVTNNARLLKKVSDHG